MIPESRSAYPVDAPRYLDGSLSWYGCSLNEIADEFGTPLHVGCGEAAAEALRAFRAPFIAQNLPIEVRFSVKTNPLPIFLATVRNEDAGFEVCSIHELQLLQHLKVPGDRIIATGMRNGFPYAIRAAELGVEMLTLTTPGQAHTLLLHEAELPSSLPIALSICPELRGGRWDLTLNTGARGAATGFRAGSSELENTLERISSSSKLNLIGLHMHIGSGIRSAAPYRKGLKILEKVAGSASSHGDSIRILDIGGGYGLASAPVLGTWKIFSSLTGMGGRHSESSESSRILSEVAEAVTESFRRLETNGIHIDRLLAEPGRIVSGPCQLLLLTVNEVIDRGGRNRFLLCDGGSMAISPMLMTERHRVLALRESTGESVRYRVLGNMPSGLDIVSASSILPEMNQGDRIAVLDTGAYFLSLNNTFGGTRPAAVWIEGGEAKLARMRESTINLFSRDVMPENLKLEKEGSS